MKLFEIISKICGKEKEIIEKTKSHELTKDNEVTEQMFSDHKKKSRRRKI